MAWVPQQNTDKKQYQLEGASSWFEGFTEFNLDWVSVYS